MTRPAATILFGIDVGYMTDFDTTEEFEKVAAAGMTWRDILTALTTAPRDSMVWRPAAAA